MSGRWFVVGGKARVSVQIHYILFSLRQSKHPSTTTFLHFHYGE
jgi:hypothetical protein